MELDEDFAFGPQPPIRTPLVFSLPSDDSNLGPLARLPGKWTGTGFNVIWRPVHDLANPTQDRFLELNVTAETIEFSEIPGPIPNRGLLQADINMFGVHYLQQIQDANTNSGLHIEPGLWATVPQTDNPQEKPTVVRMASIPHGTTILAQGLVLDSVDGPPKINDNDIFPFPIGNVNGKIKNFPEQTLTNPTQFRTPAANLKGVTQLMVNNPNSVLQAIAKAQKITQTTTLFVSTDGARPVVGGGTNNTAFLQGTGAGGPNAQAIVVSAIFWIETVTDPATGEPFQQLQYTQNVLLNFNGLSWPHITVGTLRKIRNSAEPTVSEGSTGAGVRALRRALRRTPDLGVAIDGPFDATLLATVKAFQSGAGLKPDGVVGPNTWAALPEAGAMPTLHLGSKGEVVKSLQNVLINGAQGQWSVAPGAADGIFGNDTQDSVRAFQNWAGLASDGVVGGATWATPLNAASATLETAVGLNFVSS